MSTHKRIDAICAAITVLTVVLTVLFMNGEALGIASIPNEETDGLFTSNDLDADWDTSFATRIALSDSGSAISGNGAYVYHGDVYIVYPGRYVLTGELTNGSVIIKASNTDKIWILLDGISLHCSEGAAIRVEQADKVFLTLADGTENTISSGAQYSSEVVDAGIDGAIYSRDDLTINGNGSLAISAEYKHGIVCNDDLVITGGNITISAAQDGIHANDSVRVRDASLSISAGDDGITASNDDETSFLYIESGRVSIPSCYEGLEAVNIAIAGGTIDIAPTDDGINTSGSGSNSIIRVTGGNISIINPTGRDADGLDSNGSIYIEGGTVFISVSDTGSNCAIDYGSENGGECVVSGGTVIACGSGMMAEGFDSSSTQGFLMYSTLAAANTAISLKDSAGQELLSAEIPCSFSSLVLSAPGLKLGDVCLLTVGDVQEQVAVDNSPTSGFAPAGMFHGGMRGEGNKMAGGPGNRGGGSDMQPPEDMQFPEDMQLPKDQAGFPSGQRPTDQDGRTFDRQNDGRDGFPGGMADGTVSVPASIDTGGVLLLALSFAVLLAGLTAAYKFKR